MIKNKSFILFFLSLLFFFSSISYAGIDSPQEAEDMRRRAGVFYSKRQYDDAERIWDSILESKYRTYEDMRRAASVYFNDKNYNRVAKIYNQIIQDQKATLGDLKNFLLSLSNLMRCKENIDNYSESIEFAYNKVHASEYSDGYELNIAEKVFNSVNKEKRREGFF